MTSTADVPRRRDRVRRGRRGVAVATVLVLAGLIGVGPGVGPAAAVTTVGFGVDENFAAAIGTGANQPVNQTALQPDGKILVGGQFTTFGGAPANRLVRLNPDGTTDTAFSAALGTGFNNGVYSVALQPDGKVLVTGDFTTLDSQPANRLVRLNSDGSLDAAFQANLGSGFGSGRVQRALPQPDGKIVVIGTFTSVQGVTQRSVARLNADGSPDVAFNANRTGTGGGTAQLYDGSVLANGKILLCGAFPTFDGRSTPGLVRLNADGTLDTTYSLVLPSSSRVTSFSNMPDGSIFMGGFFTINGTQGLARLTADGELDVARTAALGSGAGGATSSAQVFSVAARPDGKLYVGGDILYFDRVPVADDFIRLNADGSLDTAFDTYLGAGFDNRVNTITVQPDGLILVAGVFSTFQGRSAPRLLRLGDVHLTVQVADRVSAVGAAVNVPVDASATLGGALNFTATGLPPGVGIDAVSGVMSGAASTPGVYSVTVQVDQPSSGAAESGSFTWTVASVGVVSPGNQTTIVGTPVDLVIDATSSDGGPVTFSASGLPVGLSIDSVTGRITGTPTVVGPVSVSVTATHTATGVSDTVTFGWAVTAVVVTVTSPGDQVTAIGGVVDVPVTATATVPGAITFDATGLPAGLSIDAGTGQVTGTPSVAGTSNVTVIATHTASGTTGVASFTWSVVAVAVTSPGDQADPVGTVVDLPVAATSTDGGAVTFAATGLPAGLVMDTGTGSITGTTTTPGVFTVQVTATHTATGAAGAVSFAWTVVAVDLTDPGPQASSLNVPVSLPLTATSTDSGPVTFVATGLPTGLDIDSVTGAVTGTPTATGPFTVQVTATHTATGATDTVTFTWTITAVVVTVTGPGDQLGVPGVGVDVPVGAAASAPGPVEFTATGLPPGVDIDPATGQVTGTPTAAGVFTVQITATHTPSGATGGASFTWTLVAVTVTSPGDQIDAVGAVVDVPVSATSTDAGAVTFTATGLPAGLSMNTTTGQVTGTVTTAGVSTVVVTATHTATGATGTASFTWTVVAVTVTSPGDQLDAIGVVVDVPVSATSTDAGPVTFTATGLPAGVDIDPDTGAITGTTTTAGSSTVVVTATHTATGATGTASFTWTVVAVTVTSPGDQVDAVGVVVDVPVTATSTDGGPVTFAATGLPAGLVMDSGTGSITGTTTTPGVFTVQVTATHTATGATGAVSFAWTVVAVDLTDPGDQTSSLNVPVSLPLTATSTDGGSVTFTATGLPTGLDIDLDTGQVTGTPTAAGPFTVQITATHTATGATDTVTFTWTVTAVVVTVTGPGDQLGVPGIAVDIPVSASASAPGPVEFTATGLPPGVGIDPVTGAITGTPTAAGVFTVQVTATHTPSGATGAASFTWTLVAVTVTGPSDQIDPVGAVVDVPITATSTDAGPVTFTATGLPAGLSMNTTTGQVTGTITTAGVFTVQVTATHAATGATGTASFTWTVVTVTVTSPGDQLDAIGAVVDVPVTATSTDAGPVTLTATGLPAGVDIDPTTGAITGTSTAAGVFTVQITATHTPSGATGAASFTWTVVAVTVTSPGDQVDAVGAVVDVPLSATSTDAGPVTFTATGLPAGVDIDPATGAITGTATTAGSSTVVVTATHTATSATGTASFTWTVVTVTVTGPGDQIDPVGAFVDVPITATSTDAGPVTFTATGLPAGVDIDPATGASTGTATAAGVFTVQVTANHTASGATGTASFTWTVVAVTVTGPGDQIGPVGAVVDVPITATSTDAGAVTFTATGLPAGLSINTTTGQVTGTTTTPGVFTVQVTATHTATGATGTVSFAWVVVAVDLTDPGDQTSSLGQPVSLDLTATSTDSGPVTFVATGLPTGLSIDLDTGQVTGTPTAAGVFTVQVTATHTATGATGTVTFAWTVTSVVVTVTDPGAQLDAVGAVIDLPVPATATDPGPITFTTSGLPTGLSTDPDTGTITGTVSTPGVFTVQVTATHTPSGATGAVSFTWTVVAVDLPAVSDQVTTIGTPVDLPLPATATDNGPLTYTAIGLPAGLVIGPGTGIITGTPTIVGTTDLTVTATHTATGATTSVAFTWTITAVAVTLTGPADQADVFGSVVDLPVSASASAPGPITFTATGLPDGLSIDPVTGRITGTPTAVGAFTVTVTATHTPSGANATATFAWVVTGPEAGPVVIAFNPPPDQDTITGDRVDLHLDAVASDGAALVFAAGGLPPGLSIDPTTGQITGAPTTPGTYLVTLTATHPTGVSVTLTFTWEVLAAPGPGGLEGLLARTGAAPTTAALTALTLIGAGTWFLLTRRRRRNTDTNVSR